MEEALKVAAASLKEPGCERYEILTLQGSERRGMLYEVFRDETDHRAHTKTAHFAASWKGVADLSLSWKVDKGWLRENNVFESASGSRGSERPR